MSWYGHLSLALMYTALFTSATVRLRAEIEIAAVVVNKSFHQLLNRLV